MNDHFLLANGHSEETDGNCLVTYENVKNEAPDSMLLKMDKHTF